MILNTVFVDCSMYAKRGCVASCAGLPLAVIGIVSLLVPSFSVVIGRSVEALLLRAEGVSLDTWMLVLRHFRAIFYRSNSSVVHGFLAVRLVQA